MTFGLEILNAAGNTSYSSDDVTWNQVDFLYVPANGGVGSVYPVLEGRSVLTVQMFVNPPPNDRRAIAHTVTINGNGVYASGGTEAAYLLVLMR